jgi:hypothetical protein
VYMFVNVPDNSTWQKTNQIKLNEIIQGVVPCPDPDADRAEDEA